MNSQIQLAQAVQQRYALKHCVLYPLIQEEGRCLYRIEQDDASPLLLRTYAYPGSDARQAQHSHILQLLDTYGYPAPRLMRTQSGEEMLNWIDGDNTWCCVVTTFIEGQVIEGDAPETLRIMGETLGHFHAFSQSLPIEVVQQLSPALWRPKTMIPLAQQELAALQPALPANDQVTVRQLQAAIEALPSFQQLPAALNHGDCVPTNAVMTPAGEVILIDWADAGWGELIFELAWLLLMGMGGIPDGSPQSVDAAIDPARLYAVVDGYCRYRVPTAAECSALFDAICFVPAVYSALEFCAVHRQESSAAVWKGWWSRYQLAPPATALAMERIEQHRRAFDEHHNS